MMREVQLSAWVLARSDQGSASVLVAGGTLTRLAVMRSELKKLEARGTS